ncbi:MAG: alpha/beta hydrolase [Planctomycetota bacterium]
MRVLPFAVLVSITLSAGLPAQRGGDDGPGRGEREGRGERGEAPRADLANFVFREIEIPTENLAEGPIRCGAYLPKGFDDEANAGRTWPLVVWLHGFGGYREFDMRGGTATLDELRGQQAIPEMVFVTFRAAAGRRGRCVYVNGERAGKVEDAIVGDVVPYAIEHLRVSKAPAQHAIMGISIGGYGALKIGLRHPDVFGVVAAHSSAVFPDDPKALPAGYERQVDRALRMGLDQVFGDPIDPARWAAEMPMGIVRNAADGAFAATRIYFDAGTDDRYGFADPNRALSTLMTEKKIAHTFRLVEGGEHAWGGESMLDNLRTSLRFVAAALQPAAAKTPATGAKEAETDK